ncbi:MAG: hypothetical protein JNK84_17890 [Phreatobacter sp.]|uniref:hypothetical protein n=1 Tax=Phreatobacter sp. TaxID=1966341 RepID=UPI001A5F9FA7|nr:hypothetical protein [Phreatobacter sp.]MBL8570945.1 hypothetical protein [Phreatobacter sp.]
MTEDREQLVVDLIARVSDFERNIQKAEGTGTRSFTKLREESSRVTRSIEQDFERSTGRVNQALTSMQSHAGAFVSGLASRFAAPLSAAGILATLNKMKTELLAIDDLAKHVGLSIGQAAALRNISTGVGAGSGAIDQTLRGIADNIAEAAREESEFGKLLEANGIKLKNRHGQVISTNEALGHAARLIANAANESDRIKIAEMLGVAKELIPLFARGADNLASMRSEQERSTRGLEEAVRKARAFDEAWTSAWGNFQVSSKVALLDIGRGLGHLAEQAFTFVKGLNELRSFRVEQGPGTGIRLETPIPGITNGQGELLPNFRPPAPRNRPASADIVTPNLGPRTVIPPGSDGGGGGGSAPTDTALTRLNAYIDSLTRQDAVMRAQIATFGQSEAAQKAAMEIARAQVDLNRLDAKTREEVTKRLTDQVNESEALRVRLEALNKAQRQTVELNDFTRDSFKGLASDFTSNLANGENAWKSFGEAGLRQLQRVGDKLAQMALDNLWLNAFGGGGGLFGGGGLLGSLFGGIGGGGSTGTQLFENGGYTGAGPAAQFAGFVHKGEVVWSQRDVANAGGVAAVEAMRLGKPGFRDGGIVPPTVPSSVAVPRFQSFGAARGGGPITFAPVTNITVQGDAGKDTLAALKNELDQRDKRLEAKMPGIVAKAKRDGIG